MADDVSKSTLSLIEIAVLLEALEQRAGAANESTLAYLIHMAAFEARSRAARLAMSEPSAEELLVSARL